MSPRAAWRLEALGFEDVYDYVPGKVDWLALGLSSEGTISDEATAGDAADPNVPTCALDEAVADVRARVREAGWETCLVVNHEDVVLGQLGREALASEEVGRVEEFMTEGPTTTRPHTPREKVLDRLRERALTTAIVTTADGRLIGVVRRD